MWISVKPVSSRWRSASSTSCSARVGVRALLLLRDRERAELALHAADVRLVQIEVLDEVDLVGAAALPAREVGELAEREQVVGLHQREAVLEVEPLARFDLSREAARASRCGRGRPSGGSALPRHRRSLPAPRGPRRPRAARAPARRTRGRSRARLDGAGRPTRISAPSSDPPASASRTTSSSRAASSRGSVGMPLRRSVPGIFPVSSVSPTQSRQSSTIWNAIPSARPNAPSCGLFRPEQAGLEELRRLQRAPLDVRLDARLRLVPL